MAVVTETYKGRKIHVRSRRDRTADSGRRWTVLVNGTPASFAEQYGPDAEAKTLAGLKRDIDHIDAQPVDGDSWAAYWYAPGTYELCDYEHPREIGQPCRPGWCVREHGGAA